MRPIKQVLNLRELSEWSGMRFSTLRRMWERGVMPGAIPVSRAGQRERLVALHTFATEMGMASPFNEGSRT